MHVHKHLPTCRPPLSDQNQVISAYASGTYLCVHQRSARVQSSNASRWPHKWGDRCGSQLLVPLLSCISALKLSSVVEPLRIQTHGIPPARHEVFWVQHSSSDATGVHCRVPCISADSAMLQIPELHAHIPCKYQCRRMQVLRSLCGHLAPAWCRLKVCRCRPLQRQRLLLRHTAHDASPTCGGDSNDASVF